MLNKILNILVDFDDCKLDEHGWIYETFNVFAIYMPKKAEILTFDYICENKNSFWNILYSSPTVLEQPLVLRKFCILRYESTFDDKDWKFIKYSNILNRDLFLFEYVTQDNIKQW